MPPSKKQKTAFEQAFAMFLEKALHEFDKVEKNGTISVFKLRQACTKLKLELDETLLTEEDSSGIDHQRFQEIVGQLKRESDCSMLFDYVYDYLAYSGNQITLESLIKALKTLPRQPKQQRIIAEMYTFANQTTSDQPLTKDQLRVLLRKTSFFSKHYNESNVNSSFIINKVETDI